MPYEPLGLAGLPAHSGPPLAAFQGNSRARTASLAFSACHSRRYTLPLPRRPALALVSYSGLWVPLFPWLKGKRSKPSKETP